MASRTSTKALAYKPLESSQTYLILLLNHTQQDSNIMEASQDCSHSEIQQAAHKINLLQIYITILHSIQNTREFGSTTHNSPQQNTTSVPIIARTLS